jgi:hypothetical protein
VSGVVKAHYGSSAVSHRDNPMGYDADAGITPLMLAARNGHLEALRLLLGSPGRFCHYVRTAVYSSIFEQQ